MPKQEEKLHNSSPQGGPHPRKNQEKYMWGARGGHKRARRSRNKNTEPTGRPQQHRNRKQQRGEAEAERFPPDRNFIEIEWNLDEKI